MAVRIRLRRIGAKKRPFYRVVVADSRSPRDGRFLDTIGWYDPLAQPVKIKIDEGKALQWLAEGAEPTDSARSILTKAGIWRRHNLGEAATAIGTSAGAGEVPASEASGLETPPVIGSATVREGETPAEEA